MSDISDPTLPIRPRVIVEQQADGSLAMEWYVNGQRTREILNPGFELFEIKDALLLQSRKLQSEIERKKAALLAAEGRRHNTVWRYVATGHGVEFANRTVNGVKSSKLNAKVDAKPVSGRSSLKEMIDLL